MRVSKEEHEGSSGKSTGYQGLLGGGAKQRVLLGPFERSKFTSVVSRSFPGRTSQENGG